MDSSTDFEGDKLLPDNRIEFWQPLTEKRGTEK